MLVISYFARPFDYFLSGYKIPFAISTLGIITLLTSRALRGLTTKPGFALLLLAGWMTVCGPFSYYRAGSAVYVEYYIGVQVVLFLVAAAAPRSFRDLRRIAYVMVGAIFFYILIGARVVADRMALVGSFGNSNDVAMMGGFAIPFVVLASQRLRNPFARFAVLIAGCSFLVRAVGLSASRTGVIDLAVLVVIYLYYAKGRQRVAILATAVVGMGAMILILPSTTLERLGTISEIFQSDTELGSESANEAAASTLERKEILGDAIETTLTHPLLGVGPGQFVNYRFTVLGNSRTKHYLPTHNTYLEFASDTGIPGLIFYLCFLGGAFAVLRSCFRLNRPGSHPDAEAGRQLCIALLAALVYFVVCAFFLTYDSYPHQYLVAGLIVALERISALLVKKNTTPAAVGNAVTVKAVPAFAPAPAPAPAAPQPALRRPRSLLRRPR